MNIKKDFIDIIIKMFNDSKFASLKEIYFDENDLIDA